MSEKHTLDRRQFLKATAGAAAAAVAATPLIQALPAAAQEMMYSQAPMLDDMGLPPVEERLPSNPRVIPVFEEIGEHGGTWRRGYKGRADMQGPAKLFYAFGLHFQYTADLSSVIIVPGLYDEWSQNDDSTEYTFHMREGMKWSDGHPFTTTDVQFWYDWYQNGEIGATRSVLNVGGQNLDLEVVDEETFICRLGQPSPLLPFKVARDDTEGQHGGPTMAAPSHYLSQFVQDHENANQEMIDAAVAANEVPTWQELFGTGGTPRGPISWWATNPDVPVVHAWWMEKPLPFNDPIVLVRNPYFYSVDETGQQLPYVDRIEHTLFEDSAVFDLWITQGLIDMQVRHVNAANFSLYKELEEEGDYRVLLWRGATTNAYHPNTSSDDPRKRAIFSDPRFREALSIAIDRHAINDLIYDGLLEPRQGSPVSGSPDFSAELEQRWTEHDPEKAMALLDDMGMAMGGDGFRTAPDGEPINFQLMHAWVGSQTGTDEVGQVIGSWRAIGLNVTEDGVERSLYQQRAANNQVDIGTWDVDRSLIIQADPRSYIGDSPQQTWALKYNRWRTSGEGENSEEPPEDHPIRRIWAIWEQVTVEPDADKRSALMQELMGVHAEAPFAIGTVGEAPQPVIVSNRMRNVPNDIVDDTSLRNVRVAYPEQFFFKSMS